MSKVPHCSAEITAEFHRHLIFLVTLNIFLSITAFLWNALILLALRKESASLKPPSKLLYRNLAITDLCVGIIVQPLAVVYWISVVYESWSTCYYAFLAVSITGSMLCLVSCIDNIDCNKRGQTSRVVVVVQVPEGCDSKEILYNCSCYLGFVPRWFSQLCLCFHNCVSLYSNLNFILHKNFSLAALLQDSCPWTRLSKSTKPSYST